MSRPSPPAPHRAGPPGALVGLLCLVAGGVGGCLVGMAADTSPPPKTDVRVPNTVGITRQDAQYRLREAGLYRLDERDATGRPPALGRFIVDQSPSAGTTVPRDTLITLYR